MSTAVHASAVIRAALRLPRWLRLPHQPAPGTTVPENFLGIHAAGSPLPAAEEALLSRLTSLPFRQIKLDLHPEDPSPHALQLLDRLARASFRVLLRLTPKATMAASLDSDSAARRRWRAGMEKLPDWAGWAAVEAVEIGATVNRRRWSGFTPDSLGVAWADATAVFRPLGITLAGPNVSDFEPTHLLAFLDTMRRHGGAPDVATVNLFVERARTPEAFDARVAGRLLAPRLRLNLFKKAAILRDAALAGGARGLWSTHACWHKFRLERWSSDPETLRAAYLARYLLCAAASGTLDRVYWGTLVGCPEGLVEDGVGPRAGLERVVFYNRAEGDPADWADLPALSALRFMGGQLPGSVLLLWRESGDGSVHSTWNHPSRGPWHAAWNARDVESPAPATTGTVWDVCGVEFPNVPMKLGPRPMIWRGPP